MAALDAQCPKLFHLKEAYENLQQHGTARIEHDGFERLLAKCFGKEKIAFSTPPYVGLMAKDGDDEVKAMKSLLAELTRPDLQEVRLQCSVVTMPVAAAAAAGLKPDAPLPADEAAAGKLVKLAVAAGGSLRNLPEGGGLPLVPFVAGRGPHPAVSGATVRVHVQALPLAADEWFFAVQAHEEMPVQGQPEPKDVELVDVGVKLQLGQGVLAVRCQADRATVVWLRCLGTRTAGLPKAPVKAPDAVKE